MSGINRLKAVSPFSRTVSANQFLFVSGQIGIDQRTGELVTDNFEAETHHVMKNIKALLKENDLHFSDLVSVTIYLKDMNNYQCILYTDYFMNKIFNERVFVFVYVAMLIVSLTVIAFTS